MAWKELLQQQDPREDSRAEAAGAARDRSSLIRQVCADTGPTEEAAAASGTDRSRVCLPDGYVRRSPEQRYRTAPDYRRRIIRKVVAALVVLAFLALVVLAILKSGLFRLN